MSSQAAVKKINNKIRMTPGEKVGVTIIYGMLILFSLAFLMPFLYVVSTSITSEKALAENGVTLIPSSFSLDAYVYLFEYSKDILRAFFNTIIIAGATVVLMIVVTSLFAYPLSKKDLPGRTAILGYVMFSMMFGGGLIPTYILMHEYGFANNWLCMILPGCFSAWNINTYTI